MGKLVVELIEASKGAVSLASLRLGTAGMKTRFPDD